MGMRVFSRNPMWLGRRGQTGARLGNALGTSQRQRHCRLDIAGCAQRVESYGPALCYLERRAVFVGHQRVAGRVAMHTPMQMHKTRVFQLHHARMGVDERGHRLQGDEQPEHQ